VRLLALTRVGLWRARLRCSGGVADAILQSWLTGMALAGLAKAALAGLLLAGSGSCYGGRDYKAARELGILDR
jgi:hypothetical protein